jgi:Holliday junction DNA helicase RuvA
MRREGRAVISSVRGEVLSVGLDHAVVEVGGVGLAVQATPSTLARLRRGQPARLDTALVVREDSLTLFGFADAAERELFGLLQTVSGVGPRLALATLAVLDPAALSHALADGNLTTLMSVPGIGRKGAERLVVELRDKVAPPGAGDAADGEVPSSPVAAGSLREQVVEALVGLGFAAKPAEKAVDEVLGGSSGSSGPSDSSAVLRAALSRLGPR